MHIVPITEDRCFITYLERYQKEFGNLENKSLQTDLQKVIDTVSDSIILGLVFYLSSHSIDSNKVLKQFATTAKNATDKLAASWLQLHSTQGKDEIVSKWRRELHYTQHHIPYCTFSFIESDFSAARIDSSIYYSRKKDQDCFDFAFFMLNESLAFTHMFESNWITSSEVLRGWGYREVSYPVGGDLVVYANEKQNTHYGVAMGSNFVLSKFCQYEVSYHPVEYVDIRFGGKVTYFRKDQKCYLTKAFLKELETAQAAVTNFSHPTTHSPLTKVGTFSVLSEILRNMPVEQTFTRSLYNFEFNEKARTAIENVLVKVSRSPLNKSRCISDMITYVSTIDTTISTSFSLNGIETMLSQLRKGS